ncbi:MAG: single-stranded DNA-binding protein [Actinomycetota bacterium]
MNLNIIVITGRLAAEPELTTFASGSRLVRLLVTVRSDEPRRRIDVLPVVMWDPAEHIPLDELTRGAGVWIAGSVQRRFWSAEAGRTSRVEIVAHDVALRPDVDSGEKTGSNAA